MDPKSNLNLLTAPGKSASASSLNPGPELNRIPGRQNNPSESFSKVLSETSGGRPVETAVSEVPESKNDLRNDIKNEGKNSAAVAAADRPEKETGPKRNAEKTEKTEKEKKEHLAEGRTETPKNLEIPVRTDLLLASLVTLPGQNFRLPSSAGETQNRRSHEVKPESRSNGKTNVFSVIPAASQILNKNDKKTTDEIISSLLDKKIILRENSRRTTAPEKKPSAQQNQQQQQLQPGMVSVVLDPNRWSVNNQTKANEMKPTLVEGAVHHRTLRETTSSREHRDSGSENREKKDRADLSRIQDAFQTARREITEKTARFETSDPVLARNREAFQDLVEKARLNIGSDGRSSASIRLNPASLGSMTLNLKVTDNQVEARLVVDNQAARKIMQEELENLKIELKNQGINVDHFEIKVRESFTSDFQNTDSQTRTALDNQEKGASDFQKSSDSVPSDIRIETEYPAIESYDARIDDYDSSLVNVSV